MFGALLQVFTEEQVTSLLCYLTRSEAWTNATWGRKKPNKKKHPMFLCLNLKRI